MKGRILISKIGLDGHDRGAKVVARALKEAGFEVIYTGLHKTPKEVADIALEEDVDLIGVSILSGAHNTLIPKLIEELKQRKIEDKPIVVGGIIPDEDFETLKSWGVKAIFIPGTPLKEIIETAEKLVKEYRKNKEL
jgi:methylmalonyl-CoA mutase C-terminal domain/subunit